MGTDGFIFERKSKRYYSYDRDYNLFALAASNYYPDTPVNDKKCMRADEIRYALMEDGAKVSATDVIEMCDYLAVGFSLATDEHENQRQYAADKVRKFAQAFPDGEFFIRLDNDDAYDLIKDMHGSTDSWTGEYSEWKP